VKTEKEGYANFDTILAEIADFFFIDTTPFQLKYWTHPKGNHYDWRGVAPREKYITNLLKVHIYRNRYIDVRHCYYAMQQN
jgi:hypothetical protein